MEKQGRPVTVAFVGTGVMGASMAGHLLDAGHPLVVFNRTRAKAEPLLARGAEWAGTPGQAAQAADVVVTMVGYPTDVEECYLGAGGIVECARPGALLIDMTTSTPTLAARIAVAASARQVRAIDAPVSGGDIGAREARLTIMCGGAEEDVEAARPLLENLGKSIVRQGGAGAGQHAKMCNQIAVAGTMLGVIEALAYARGAGLKPARVLESIGGGAAASWTMTNLAPRVLAGDLAPGFYVKHFVKDLRIACEEADALGLDLPGLSLARRLYERLCDEGGAEFGTQALWLLYGEG